MKKPLFLLFAVLTSLAGFSQSRDTLYSARLDTLYSVQPYSVRLKDGSTVHSNNIQLVNSFTQGKYLRLDNSRQIPLSKVTDFNGQQGTFAVGNIDGEFDVYKLETEGPRISLYSQCLYETETVFASTTPGGPQFPTTLTSQAKAFYFRKNDSDIQRLNYQNLKLAVGDDPASLRELRLGRTDLFLGIGLFTAGIVMAAADIHHTIQLNNNAQNAYNAASKTWFNQTLSNPNAPMPTLPPHYGVSALFYLGLATTISAVIPLASIGKHTHNALYIYNNH